MNDHTVIVTIDRPNDKQDMTHKMTFQFNQSVYEYIVNLCPYLDKSQQQYYQLGPGQHHPHNQYLYSVW